MMVRIHDTHLFEITDHDGDYFKIDLIEGMIEVGDEVAIEHEEDQPRKTNFGVEEMRLLHAWLTSAIADVDSLDPEDRVGVVI